MASKTTHANFQLSSAHFALAIMDQGAIEIDACKKEELRAFLYKYWPDTIEIVNGLQLGKEFSVKIFTDNCWPDVKTVILIYNEGSITFIFSFGTDNPKTASLLKSVIDSNLEDGQEPSIHGTEEFILELKKVMGFQVLAPPIFRFTYTISKDINSDQMMEKKPLPEGYKIDSIQFSDIKFVASKWGEGGDIAQPLINNFVTNYPSVAIYDTSTEPAQPVSWIVSTAVGILYHLFTVEEHRGKGLATIVIQEQTCKILAKGLTPFCYIYADNVKSQGLFEKCGYVNNKLDLSYTHLDY